MRVGFLFNHYGAHQVPHAAPYAFELSRHHPEFEVVIACSSNLELRTVNSIGGLYPGHRCETIRLRAPRAYRGIDPLVSKVSLLRKHMILRHNLKFFRSLDALVAPERHCMKLRTHFGLAHLTMIHCRHGAGDREGGFDDRSGTFDLTLLPGQKYVDRLRELGHLRPGHYAVAGWPKFEIVTRLKKDIPRFFQNDNPTVVYNPHFDQSVSSWGPMGIRVLEFFLENLDYNLIFAPHLVLFKRSVRHHAHLPSRYARAPNIWIDTGSLASADMTYMLAADMYLGDVSSQVYEFLLKPRPCIFLNGHGVPWQDNPFYLHWTLGQVVDHVERDLRPALDNAFTTHPSYISRQREAFAYTFRMEAGSTAAERGADAIARFLDSQHLPERASVTPGTQRRGEFRSKRRLRDIEDGRLAG